MTDLHFLRVTNEIYTYDEQSQNWKQTIPPMPTARLYPGVLGFPSVLVVAGGGTGNAMLPHANCNPVEIFKPSISQWYMTDPLPERCLSLVAIGNTCYTYASRQKSFSASVDDLLGNAVPANQSTSRRSSSDTRSAWKALPNTPTEMPAAAVLAGNLLAVGEIETGFGTHKTPKKEVHMYSRSTNSWIYIGDLPDSISDNSVAVLSSTEILVIIKEGWGSEANSMYKGTLHCQLKL